MIKRTKTVLKYFRKNDLVNACILYKLYAHQWTGCCMVRVLLMSVEVSSQDDKIHFVNL